MTPARWTPARLGRRLTWVLATAAVLDLATAAAAPPQQPPPSPPSPPAPQIVDLKAADGTLLKASYFAAGKPGPGVLLLHQSNRERKSWDGVAGRLAAAGIHTLTLDMRGCGESGDGPFVKLTTEEKARVRRAWPGDVDLALQHLASRPGVRRDVLGVGGAGSFGVDQGVEAARRHPAAVKSLALLSGETLQPGLQFLRQATRLPELFVVADDDEYPPTVEAMELLYVTSSSPAKKLVHYSASADAPWIWYETFDAARVPAQGGHGTDLFGVHPELPGIVVDWFVTTLIQTPGHAPADTLAAAAVLDRIRRPGGVAEVRRQLVAARRRDPQAELFPEIAVSILGQDHLRAGEPKAAVAVFELLLLAYPDSADAHESLAEACLAAGQKKRARQLAERALALLDSHALPASSWTDTEPYRGEIRHGAEKVLQQLGATP